MIAIDGGLVLDGRDVRPGTILIDANRIAAIAWSGDDRHALRARADETFDASASWVIPGLIDAHAHSYGALLRGTENGFPLEQWALFTVAYGRTLDAQSIRAAILLGAAERIRGGITGLIDHAPQTHLAEASLAAHEDSGLRVGYAAFLHDRSDTDLLGIELTDRARRIAGTLPALDADAYAGSFAGWVAAARAGSGRVRMLLGPNAPQRCSPAAWALWRTLRDRHDVPVHTHLLETRAQARLNRNWPGGLVAELERHGLLDARLSVAHGVWLTAPERDMLARHGVTLSHNPASNLMLGSGRLDLSACRRAGLRLALGTDSANTGGRHDLFEVMRLAMMQPRPDLPDPADWPTAAEVLEMASAGVPGVGRSELRPGILRPGAPADLAVIGYRHAGTLALHTGIDSLVQHAGREDVRAVMADGRWLLRDGRILVFDEARVIADAAAAQAAMRERLGDTTAHLHATLPLVAESLGKAAQDNRP